LGRLLWDCYVYKLVTENCWNPFAKCVDTLLYLEKTSRNKQTLPLYLGIWHIFFNDSRFLQTQSLQKLSVYKNLRSEEIFKAKLTASNRKDGSNYPAASRESKKILKDVIDVFTNSPKPSTPFNNLFKEITTLDKIRNDKMPINELRSQLRNVRILLSNKTFQEILGQASIDENSEVSLKQILEALNTNKPAPEFEDLCTALQTVNLMNCNRIQTGDLKDPFDDLNVSVKPEEHQMLVKTLDVDGIYNYVDFPNKSLKSGIVMPPALVFLFNITLAIQGLVWFPTN
ncbi:ef-hand domain-containing protein, partial [Lynx pardinus]